MGSQYKGGPRLQSAFEAVSQVVLHVRVSGGTHVKSCKYELVAYGAKHLRVVREF